MRRHLGCLAATTLACSSLVFASGDCAPARPLTTAESQWLDQQIKALDQALPAPADWLRFTRAEFEGGGTSLDRPESVCTGVERYAMTLRKEALYAPRGSALARRVEITRRLNAIRQDEQPPGPGADPGGVADPTMDLMRIQQELLAAMQRGDSAAVERLGQQMEQATAGQQAAAESARREGESTMQRQQGAFAERERLERELQALQEPARASPRVAVTLYLNSTGGAARDKTGARDLKLSGAQFAWINTERGCGESAAAAYALFGDYTMDPWDAGDARIFELKGPAKNYAQSRGVAVGVCGSATEAAKFLDLIRGDALRR